MRCGLCLSVSERESEVVRERERKGMKSRGDLLHCGLKMVQDKLMSGPTSEEQDWKGPSVMWKSCKHDIRDHPLHVECEMRAFPSYHEANDDVSRERRPSEFQDESLFVKCNSFCRKG